MMIPHALLALTAGMFGAPTLPPGFFAQEVAPSLEWDAITGIAVAADGRIFVAEKRGRVYVVFANVRLPVPFLNIEAEVLNSQDRGLLGIALDPAFETNGRVYVLYTVDPDGDGKDTNKEAFGRLARYTTSVADPNVADPASRTVLIGQGWSTAPLILSSSHTIGCLRFGLDGSLLMSAGDGAEIAGTDAGGRNPVAFVDGRANPMEDIGAFRSQWIGSLAGKLLRLDPETGGGLPTNPFYTGNPFDNASRVWAYGLRNPFRFTIRPGTADAASLPGVLYIADVGWSTWEELNVCAGPGMNFGWPCREGPAASAGYPTLMPAHHGCSTLGTTENPSIPTGPLLYWNHTTASQSSPPDAIGKAASCIGFVAGNNYPADYRDACFFGDFDRGWVRRARVDDQNALIDVVDFIGDAAGPVDIASDPTTGDLLFVSIVRNQIWRIRHGATSGDPVAQVSASPTSGSAPLTVQFSSAGTVDPNGDPLQLVWLFGDDTISTEADPVHTYSIPGRYHVILSVVDPGGGLGSADIEVQVGSGGGPNDPPTATILEPPVGSTFYPQVEVLLRGEGTDAEDPAQSLELNWEVVLHHNTHVHPEWFTFTGPSASFLPGDHDDGTGVWFEVILRVKDSAGLVGLQQVEVHRETAPLILDNGAPGTSAKGNWSLSGGLYPYGLDSVYSKAAGNTYSYTFPLTSSGAYRTYAWWSVFDSRTTAAPYTIFHSAGQSTVAVNQRIGEQQWNYLGTFTFENTAKVTITAVGGTVSTCADAVLLLPLRGGPRQPPVAYIDGITPASIVTGQPVALAGHGETAGLIQAYEWSSDIDGVIGAQASVTTSSLSIGMHTIRFRVEDDLGMWSEPAEGQVEVIPPPPPGAEIIVDNSGPGTSFTGSWIPSSGASPYGATSLYTKTAGHTYVWQAALAQAGTYDVFAWWSTFSSRPPAATYTIAGVSGPVNVTVNQRSGGGRWNLLGKVTFGSTGKVTLTCPAGGYSTSADAVRFVLAGAGEPPPTELIFDNGDPGTSSTGSWIASGGANPYGGSSLYAKFTTSSYTYLFPLAQAGTYEVFAWWTSIASRSASVPYTVTHDGGTTVVNRSQLQGGGQWNSLGTFHFTGSATVRIDARPDGFSYCADAVSVRRVGN